jgi:Putative Ig domain/RTX calcium-binding nonapeptide repeat (4 copies)
MPSNTVTLANGAPLPSWLAFNPNGLKFTGVPPTAAINQNFDVRLTATDLSGASSSDVFRISIAACVGLNLLGTSGNDRLVGSACNDTIDGKAGYDTMIGGKGDDTYYVDKFATASFEPNCEPTSGLGDVVVELAAEGWDTVFSTVSYVLPANVEALTLLGTSRINGAGNELDNWLTGNSAANVLDGGQGADRMLGGAGDDTYIVDNLADLVIESASEGTDLVQTRVSHALSNNVENLTALGSAALVLTGNALNNVLTANNAGNRLDGGAGNDTLKGGAGADILIDLAGDTSVSAGSGNDYVLTGAGVDTIRAGTGNDVVQSGAGNDNISTLDGNDVLDLGAGNDTLDAAGSNNWMAAGLGNDSFTFTGDGNVLAFNKGDGVDVVNAAANCVWNGANDTLSLGKGIRYADLKLSKDGYDLMLSTGAGESVTLRNWYASTNRGIGRLQVVTVGGDYNATSSDVTKNNQVEVFDFGKLVQRFDAARATNSTVANGWAVMNSLLSTHIGGSDTAAIGGDLSFQYATTGNLTGVSLSAAQAVVGQSLNMQVLHPRSQITQGATLLA